MSTDPNSELPEVTVEPVPEPLPPRAPVKAPPRSLLARLFGISVWGSLKLLGLCILVGFFVLASQFNPSNPDVDMGSAIANVASTTMAALGWAVRNFWKPALAGAAVVIPIWVLWRLVSLPFRK